MTIENTVHAIMMIAMGILYKEENNMISIS